GQDPFARVPRLLPTGLARGLRRRARWTTFQKMQLKARRVQGVLRDSQIPQPRWTDAQRSAQLLVADWTELLGHDVSTHIHRQPRKSRAAPLWQSMFFDE